MMILQVCNASFAFKLEDASMMLDDLALATFPGENVRKFAHEAQRLIQILKGVCPAILVELYDHSKSFDYSE